MKNKKEKMRCTKMNHEIFQEFLISTLQEISQIKKITLNNYLFIIKPNYEWELGLKGDSVMRYYIFENIDREKRYTIDEVTKILGWDMPHLPLWINVSYLFCENETNIFQLESSARMRKPTLLNNQETGHPPFKAILE